MKTYAATYKFEENKISYEAKVSGQIFETANDEINFNHISDLKKGFANHILNAVISAINSERTVDAKLMQSNANNAFSVLIDGNLYPISMNIAIEVTSNPFELLTNHKE